MTDEFCPICGALRHPHIWHDAEAHGFDTLIVGGPGPHYSVTTGEPLTVWAKRRDATKPQESPR